MGRLADAYAAKQAAFTEACCGNTADADRLQIERDVLAIIATEELLREVADLRDRLRVLEPMVCRCGYHALGVGKQGELWPLCPDCMISLWGGDGRAAACLANGMKALCGRRILEGCE